MISRQLHRILDTIDSRVPSEENETFLGIKGSLISIIEQAEAVEQELAKLKADIANLEDSQRVIIQGLADQVGKSKVSSHSLRTLIAIHQHFDPIPEFLTAGIVSSVTNSNKSFVVYQLNLLHKEGYILLEDIDFDHDGPYIKMMPKGTEWLIENGYITEH
jgi:hypothetical protein